MPLQGNDAAIFDLMHSLLAEEGREQKLERRNNGRQPFPKTQLLAPCDDQLGDVDVEKFQRCECYDLSVSGVSYFSNSNPNYNFITLAMGQAPFKFLVAKVCNTRQFDDGRWLVGCKFVRRLT